MLFRDRLHRLTAAERERYATSHPASQALFGQAGHLIGRVPMTWMSKWSGGFPLYLDTAAGARVTDVDGQHYADLALGDTGAMAGHSAPAVTAAISRRAVERGGITTMLPAEDAFAILDDTGNVRSRPGNVGPAVDPTSTTRVAHFNDLESVRAELEHGDVAVIVTEPALTNIGIVLPEPGFLEGLRQLAS